MSGLGPPGVWAAQKRLESWARAARERTSSASSGQSHNSTDSFGDDKSHGSPSVSTQIISSITYHQFFLDLEWREDFKCQQWTKQLLQR